MHLIEMLVPPAENPYAAELAPRQLARLKECLAQRVADRRSSASERDPLASRQPGNVGASTGRRYGSH